MEPIDVGQRIEPTVLSAEECDAVIGALANSAASSGRAGTRHLMSNHAVNELAHDERLLRIARVALGGSAIPFRATLFAKSADASWLIPWHQDTALPLVGRFDDPQWSAWSHKAGVLYAHAPARVAKIVALRIHLDASTHDNGPLRVVPGSHQVGVLTDREVSDYVKRHKETICLVPRGGVLAMRPLLIHSSSKAQTADPRRVLHIEYADSLELAPGIQLAVA